MKRFIALIICIVFLQGCTSTYYSYDKKGISPKQQDLDYESCYWQARGTISTPAPTQRTNDSFTATVSPTGNISGNTYSSISNSLDAGMQDYANNRQAQNDRENFISFCMRKNGYTEIAREETDMDKTGALLLLMIVGIIALPSAKL